MNGIEMHSVVALVEDLPQEGLVRGQVGTVVENWAAGVYEVEGHTPWSLCTTNPSTRQLSAVRSPICDLSPALGSQLRIALDAPPRSTPSPEFLFRNIGERDRQTDRFRVENPEAQARSTRSRPPRD